MKVILLFLAAVGFTALALVMSGWKNFGNQPAAVPQKLEAMQQAHRQSLAAGQAEAASPTTQIAVYSCSGVMESVQKRLPIDAELSWLEGFLAARDPDKTIPPAQFEHETLRTLLLAACAEYPAETLNQVAERLLKKLQAR